MSGKGLSLYIHVPFCKEKCPYCDFNSFKTDSIDEDLYVNSILKELELSLNKYSNYNFPKHFETIYFGGGTPSTLSALAYEKIFSGLSNFFIINDNTEVTIEANPGTIDRDKFKNYFKTKINRISIGIQSFNDSELKTLGRIHSVNDSVQAIEYAIDAGFKNISLDFIFALPNQSLSDIEYSIKKALTFDVQHISLYGLTYEEGTPFHTQLKSGFLKELSSDTYRAMLKSATKILTNNGYEQYEISNFCKNGFLSRHNSNYWTREDYLSLGPGAHSFLSDLGEYGARWENIGNYNEYTVALSSNILPTLKESVEELTKEDALQESILLSLRCTEGLNLIDFENNFSKPDLNNLLKRAEELKNDNLVEIANNHLILTKKALFIADSVIEKLCP